MINTIKNSSERDKVAVMTARKAREMGMYAWRSPDLLREDACARVHMCVSIGSEYRTEINITNEHEIENRLKFAKRLLRFVP